ncbi:putative U3 small nucleolar RNA-associated protein [Hamiltosporidium tvaerminnensis]|uniref:Putative U3 small nucleolar RNA-associated protein n=1 Tax=Hamiltosporidium tvaerminnensis TaxID=1176355 RepID=A0A4Q9LC79_9MICR|nr:U3 small nucleolar RNA-associated protein 13 [Hamiltosporidium tvaerminnensis]TBU05418.1 putative U3 small nucleolar RNA-associated protein [Hamiltosporidium tvaerminnensis]TBU05495.1 putative U3 small nucleolar RNA-associated protein [Hamiltosporidium tvaerminnensis]
MISILQIDRSFIPISDTPYFYVNEINFYTIFDSSIRITNLTTFKVEEIKFLKKILLFTIHNNKIITYDSALNIIDLFGNLIYKNNIQNYTILCMKGIEDFLIFLCSDKCVRRFCFTTRKIEILFKNKNSYKFLEIKNKKIFVVDEIGTVLYYDLTSNILKTHEFNEPIRSIYCAENTVNPCITVYISFVSGKLFIYEFITSSVIETLELKKDFLIFNYENQLYGINNNKIYFLQNNRTPKKLLNVYCEIIRTEIYFDNLILVTNEYDFIIVDLKDFKIKYILTGNADEITDMKMDNKKRIFISTNSEILRYLDLNDFNENGKFACKSYLLKGHRDAILSLDLSDEYLISGSRDKTAIIWRIEGKKIKKIKKLKTHTDSINGTAIFKDLIATAGKDKTLQIFKIKNDKIKTIFTKQVHSKEINSLEISKYRKMIATGSQDKSINIFDFNGTILKSIKSHTRGIWSVSFGQNILASSSSDTTVQIHNLDTYDSQILHGHTTAVVKCLVFNNDTQVISSDLNGIIKIWDTKKLKCLNTLDTQNTKIWSLFYHNGLYTGTSDGQINFFIDITESHQTAIKKSKENLIQTIFLIQRSIEDKNYLQTISLLINKEILNNSDYTVIYSILEDNFCSEILSEIIEIIFTRKEAVINAINKFIISFKSVQIIDLLLRCLIDRKMLNEEDCFKIQKNLQKQFKGILDLYSNVICYDIIK